MKNQTIRIRKEQLNRIFPDKFTKLRMEDFTNKAIENKNILNKSEFDSLVNMKGNIKKGLTGNEFIAKRKKRGIELIPFE